MSFFTALRRPPPVLSDVPATEPHTAPKGPAGPDTSPRVTPAPSAPSRAPERPPLRTWLTAQFDEIERVREAVVLDELADRAVAHGSWLAAAQSLYAPHLLENTNG